MKYYQLFSSVETQNVRFNRKNGSLDPHALTRT